jgi:hypothetical protein
MSRSIHGAHIAAEATMIERKMKQIKNFYRFISLS